jgi:hypothetical protein
MGTLVKARCRTPLAPKIHGAPNTQIQPNPMGAGETEKDPNPWERGAPHGSGSTALKEAVGQLSG